MTSFKKWTWRSCGQRSISVFLSKKQTESPGKNDYHPQMRPPREFSAIATRSASSRQSLVRLSSSLDHGYGTATKIRKSAAIKIASNARSFPACFCHSYRFSVLTRFRTGIFIFWEGAPLRVRFSSLLLNCPLTYLATPLWTSEPWDCCNSPFNLTV